MEKKIKLVIPQILEENIAPDIVVRKYITPADKKQIIEMIDAALVSQEHRSDTLDILYKDYSLIGAIIDTMTNISPDGLDVELFVSSGLWDKIKNSILNMGELMFDYKQLCQDRRYIASLEGRLGNILEKVESFLEKISSLDLSNENLQNMAKILGEQLGQLQGVYPQIRENSEVKNKKPKKSIDSEVKTP